MAVIPKGITLRYQSEEIFILLKIFLKKSKNLKQVLQVKFLVVSYKSNHKPEVYHKILNILHLLLKAKDH